MKRLLTLLATTTLSQLTGKSLYKIVDMNQYISWYGDSRSHSIASLLKLSHLELSPPRLWAVIIILDQAGGSPLEILSVMASTNSRIAAIKASPALMVPPFLDLIFYHCSIE